MKIMKHLEFDVDLKELVFEPEEISQIILGMEDCDFDTRFINSYFSNKNWRSEEEMLEVAGSLSDEAKEILKKMIGMFPND